jgi:hypothetical protein
MVMFKLRSCDAMKAIVRPFDNGASEPQSGAAPSQHVAAIGARRNPDASYPAPRSGEGNSLVIARGEATKQSRFSCEPRWIASLRSQ